MALSRWYSPRAHVHAMRDAEVCLPRAASHPEQHRSGACTVHYDNSGQLLGVILLWGGYYGGYILV